VAPSSRKRVRADRRSCVPIARCGLQLIASTLLRIGFGDSQKKPALASEDETRGR
jgi:hypothetical protein